MKFFKHIQKKEGQSAVEFILVCLVVFFFLLFFLSISFVLILSQYMDYATFMAARTYKAAHGDAQEQQQQAQTVFTSYTRLVLGSGLVKRVSPLQFIKVDPNGRDHQTEGVRAQYDLDLFYLPPLFITGRAPSSGITLTSESFLGRDPNYDECTSFFKRFTDRLGIQMQFGNADYSARMEDNGC